MNSFALGALAVALSLSTSVAVAQELKSLDGETEVFVLQLPKGDQDILPKLNEILKDKDSYKLIMGTNVDIYSATTGTSGGVGAGMATEFVDPLPRRISSGAVLTKTEEFEIIQLCMTNAKPESYGLCKKYNITASVVGPAGGN